MSAAIPKFAHHAEQQHYCCSYPTTHDLTNATACQTTQVAYGEFPLLVLPVVMPNSKLQLLEQQQQHKQQMLSAVLQYSTTN